MTNDLRVPGPPLEPFGFKIKDVSLPENTTRIEIGIDDTKYSLTGSIANGFSGTGISATYGSTYSGEPTDIFNDTVTVTADMQPYDFIPLSGIPQDIITDINTDLETKLAGISVKINGHDATDTPDGDTWRYVIEEEQGLPIKYAYVVALWDEDTGDTVTGFGFSADDVTYPESVIPGDYAVEIKYPAFVSELDITVDAYTSEDVGDEYQVDVTTTNPTQDFSNAVIASVKSSKTYPVEGISGYICDTTITLTAESSFTLITFTTAELPDYHGWTVNFGGHNLPFDNKIWSGVPCFYYQDISYDQGSEIITDYIVGYNPEANLWGAFVQNDTTTEPVPGDYALKISADVVSVDPHFESGVNAVLSKQGIAPLNIIHIDSSVPSVAEDYDTITEMLNSGLPIIANIDDGDFYGFVTVYNGEKLGIMKNSLNEHQEIMLVECYELTIDDTERTVSVRTSGYYYSVTAQA